MTQDTGVLALIDPSTAKPGPFRGVLSETFRLICWIYLRLGGWRIYGDWPPTRKLVLVAAPHTSNWDGVNMLAAAGFYRAKLRWMGKKSLTTGPFGWMLKLLGCVPVDRTSSNDVVAQMRDAFAGADDMVLAIPPEGTRDEVRAWKSGFYHIAHTADVPILMSVLDYGARRVGLAATLFPSGDYDTDLPLIQSCYAGATGKHQGKFSV